VINAKETTKIVFYRGVTRIAAEESKHEKMMPNEEGAELIEWGLRWHERSLNCGALSLLL
jgi:hypothetical protein